MENNLLNTHPNKRILPRIIALIVCLAAAILAASCAMLLQPKTSFDRRLIARRYGTILNQSNPDCDDCTDSFIVEKSDGEVITVIVKYDGRVRVFDY